MEHQDPRLEAERAVRRAEEEVRGRANEPTWDAVSSVQAPDLPATSLPPKRDAPIARQPSRPEPPSSAPTPRTSVPTSELPVTPTPPPASLASTEARPRTALDDRVKDRALGAIIASAGLGTLFVVAAIRQRRRPKVEHEPHEGRGHATYDDLTSSPTPQRAADDTETVFAEDASGARASSPRRPGTRWPWMLGAMGVGIVTALALQRLSRVEVEPVLLEIEEEEVVIPLDDPIAGN